MSDQSAIEKLAGKRIKGAALAVDCFDGVAGEEIFKDRDEWTFDHGYCVGDDKTLLTLARHGIVKIEWESTCCCGGHLKGDDMVHVEIDDHSSCYRKPAPAPSGEKSCETCRWYDGYDKCLEPTRTGSKSTPKPTNLDFSFFAPSKPFRPATHPDTRLDG